MRIWVWSKIYFASLDIKAQYFFRCQFPPNQPDSFYSPILHNHNLFRYVFHHFFRILTITSISDLTLVSKSKSASTCCWPILCRLVFFCFLFLFFVSVFKIEICLHLLANLMQTGADASRHSPISHRRIALPSLQKQSTGA